MTRKKLPCAVLLALLAALAPGCETSSPPAPSATTTPAAAAAAETLAFSIDAGDLDNHFYRRGPIAAHVLAASGLYPRIIVAFPAGDTGAGVWFEGLAAPAQLSVEGPITPVELPNGMRGVSTVIRAGTKTLRVRGAVLGSNRALREYAATGTVPDGFQTYVQPGRPLVLSRTMLDGRHVSLALEPEDRSGLRVDSDGRIVATAATGEVGIKLRATALTDEEPLAPIGARALLDPRAAGDPRSRHALDFLANAEKLNAGSWRFLTYFGRDTLISLQMLMPVLQPAPIEAGLGSVLERLGPNGEVAHEEAIGEWAVLVNRMRGETNGDLRAPAYDYSMVDDDFLLAPALARYLLDTPAGRARTAAFLDRRTSAGATYRDTARVNLARVLAKAAPFAAAKTRANLIALQPGTAAGDWRDSENGLGGGRIPYDVNAALVPAALEAAARLYESPLFDPDPALAARAKSYADAWRSAASLFRVEVSEADARARVTAFAIEQGIDPAPAVASIHGPVTFDSIALDAAGKPIPVLHSDVAFTWLYDAPSSDAIERSARRLFAPFPAGLVTPVGVVVADPAYAADAELRAMFTRHDYHGTVVWSWQEALIAAGIDRQLARADITPAARRALQDAEVELWKLIRGTQALGMGTAELWSFATDGGRFSLVPFGEGHGDADESNAVQLWSTVYLAVRPSWMERRRP
jgi:hypothetical protein